jgi:hypothetical protein
MGGWGRLTEGIATSKLGLALSAERDLDRQAALVGSLGVRIIAPSSKKSVTTARHLFNRFFVGDLLDWRVRATRNL